VPRHDNVDRKEYVMKAPHVFVGVVVVLMLVGATAAQTRPDFSGVWKPVDAGVSTPTPPVPPPLPPSAAGGPPPPPPPPRTLSLTIAHSPSELKIDRRVDSGGRELVYSFTFKLDGTESVNQMGSIVFRTKASWDGPALVLAAVTSVGDKPFGQVRDVYRLEGDELVIETTRQTPAGTFTSKNAHRKS
jgi:hypothetical protein